MWRALLLAQLVIAGCSDPAQHVSSDAAVDAPVDAFQIRRTSPFTPFVCTSGSPGDSTCPINVVPIGELGAQAAGAELRFVIRPIAPYMFVDGLTITNAPHLHLDGLAFSYYSGGTIGATGAYFEELDPGITIGPSTLEDFTAGTQLVIRVDVLY